MNKTVIQYVLSRLRELGIKDVFGVAGDYAFPIEDAVCADEEMRWIGSSNELNAAYAADGYARIHGVAAVSTTYGVGELSAINGIAGSYAEYLPVFHLVGMPSSRVQAARRLVHHSLGTGDFDVFYDMTAPVVCARAILTPENCIAETERVIAAALQERRPVYLGFPSDYATMPVVETAEPVPAPAPASDPVALDAAISAIVAAVSSSETACIVPGIMVSRYGLADQALAVINASNLPFTTMFMDKGVLDETHPNYIGLYNGNLMNEQVRSFVEGSDCVIGIGALLTDFNSGSFTANIDRSKSINILQNEIRIGNAFYKNVRMEDALIELAKRIPRKNISAPAAQGLGKPIGKPDGAITADYLYPRWQQMLKPNDLLIAETGTASMGLAFAHLPKGSIYQNQALWTSIGWATPAAFGAALAAPHRRTILVTGEGSHQLTAQEVGQFHRFGLKPIIFVLNNDGYLIERLLCEDPESSYNDLAKWNYTKLPEALGCEGWFTARVTTCAELDEAIAKAESCGTGAYIEVVTGRYEASPLSLKLHESLETLYSA
jgi:indolepyruvate decarboxylase